MELAPTPGRVTVIVGAQGGDEGKGRITDGEAEAHDVIVRGQGGSNAGHTIVLANGEPLALHQIPSGITHPGKLNIMGVGMLVDPLKFQNEAADVRKKGFDVSPDNLAISSLAHLVMPHHTLMDGWREKGKNAQGSTKSGIAFAASDKSLRIGVRAEEIEQGNFDKLETLAIAGMKRASKARRWRDRIRDPLTRTTRNVLAKTWVDATRELQPYVTDTVKLVNDKLEQGASVLAEGAQGYWLDTNHGRWPDVTSTDTTVAGALSGLGIGPNKIGRVIGVIKINKSQVGGRRFVTQIDDPHLSEQLRNGKSEIDKEKGATTGRPRDMGYIDFVEVRNVVRSGVTELAITKIDCADLFRPDMSIKDRPDLKVAVAYRHKVTGEEIRYAPSSALLQQDYEPVYIEMQAWDEADVVGVRDYDQLPQAAKDFVELAEIETGVPVTMLGVGPKREQIIYRQPKLAS